MDRYINMFINVVIRRLMTLGINKGINEGFIECAISNEDCISLIAEDVSGEFLGFRSVFF